MWPWRVKMPTQNLLRLLLLLMLIVRIMLATVCYRFGGWRLVLKLNLCSDFEHKGWSRLWSWGSGKILKLEFGQYFAADVWFRLYQVESWSRFRSLCLVEMLMFGWDFVVDAWSRFWRWNLTKICIRTTQPSGPLCIWQCLYKLSALIIRQIVMEFWVICQIIMRREFCQKKIAHKNHLGGAIVCPSVWRRSENKNQEVYLPSTPWLQGARNLLSSPHPTWFERIKAAFHLPLHDLIGINQLLKGRLPVHIMNK